MCYTFNSNSDWQSNVSCWGVGPIQSWWCFFRTLHLPSSIERRETNFSFSGERRARRRGGSGSVGIQNSRDFNWIIYLHFNFGWWLCSAHENYVRRYFNSWEWSEVSTFFLPSAEHLKSFQTRASKTMMMLLCCRDSFSTNLGEHKSLLKKAENKKTFQKGKANFEDWDGKFS